MTSGRDKTRSRSFTETVKEYAQQTTLLGKARVEERLWRMRDSDEHHSSGVERRNWLSKILKITDSTTLIERRRALLHAPKELWNWIDNKKVPFSVALQLWRDAKHQASIQNTDAEFILMQLLDKYEHAPKITNKDGVVRRQHRTHSRHLDGKKVANGDVKNKWLPIRDAIGTLISERFESLSEEQRSDLVSWLEREVKSLISEFDNKVTRLRDAEAGVEINRKQVLDACRTLSMDPPKSGKPVDISLAKKQKKRIARLYHPDVAPAGAVEVHQQSYRAVFVAYSLIEQYNRNFNEKES